MIRVIQPQSADQEQAYYALRYEVLRKPWNRPAGSERDDYTEPISIHAMAVDETGNCVGCGRIIPLSDHEAQIRSMGVAAGQRGRGVGRAILQFLETQAQLQRINRVILHARENAVDFYSRNGYTVESESYNLWGIIPHFKMNKTLNV